MKRRTMTILLAGVMAAALAIPAAADNLEDSKAKFEEAVGSVMTTDNHLMMEEGITFDIPEVEGTADALEALIGQIRDEALSRELQELAEKIRRDLQ